MTISYLFGCCEHHGTSSIENLLISNLYCIFKSAFEHRVNQSSVILIIGAHSLFITLKTFRKKNTKVITKLFTIAFFLGIKVMLHCESTKRIFCFIMSTIMQNQWNSSHRTGTNLQK